VADLARIEVEAELALESLDSTRLKSLGASVDADLPCLDAALTPQLSGRIHRLLGFAAYVSGDLDGARVHFAAARAGDPEYVIPVVVLGETHPLRELFESANVATPDGLEEMSAEGEIRIDGVVANGLHPQRPQIVQVVQDGELVQTMLWRPGQPTPSFQQAAPEEPPAPEKGPRVRGDVLASTVVFDAPPDDIGALVYGGVTAGLVVPLDGAVVAVARVGAAWTPIQDTWGVDYNVPLAWTPQLGSGLGYSLPVGEGELIPSAQAVGSATADAGLLLGGAAAVGLRWPLGGVALAAEARGGWVGGPMAALGVGLGF